MNAGKFTNTLIAIAIALVIFCISWFTFNMGLSQKLFPDVAEGFAAPVSESIEAWNAFASENAISIVARPPIVLSQAPDGTGEAPVPSEKQ